MTTIPPPRTSLVLDLRGLVEIQARLGELESNYLKLAANSKKNIAFGYGEINLKTGEEVGSKKVIHNLGKTPEVVLISGGNITLVTGQSFYWEAPNVFYTATEFIAVLRRTVVTGE